MCVKGTESCGEYEVSCAPNVPWGEIPGEDAGWFEGFCGIPYDIFGLLTYGMQLGKHYLAAYKRAIWDLLSVDLDGICQKCEYAYGDIVPGCEIEHPFEYFNCELTRKSALLMSTTHLFMGRQIVCWKQVAPLIFDAGTRIINLNTFVRRGGTPVYGDGHLLVDTPLETFRDDRIKTTPETRYVKVNDSHHVITELCAAKYSEITMNMINAYIKRVRPSSDHEVVEEARSPLITAEWVLEQFSRVVGRTDISKVKFRVAEEFCREPRLDDVEEDPNITAPLSMFKTDWAEVLADNKLPILNNTGFLDDPISVELWHKPFKLVDDSVLSRCADIWDRIGLADSPYTDRGPILMPNSSELVDIDISFIRQCSILSDRIRAALIRFHLFSSKYLRTAGDIARFEAAIDAELRYTITFDNGRLLYGTTGHDVVMAIMFVFNGWSAVERYMMQTSSIFLGLVSRKYRTGVHVNIPDDEYTYLGNCIYAIINLLDYGGGRYRISSKAMTSFGKRVVAGGDVGVILLEFLDNDFDVP